MVADFESLLDCAGFGIWQLRLLALVSLNQFFQAFQNLGSIFLAATPNHWCHIPDLPENLTQDEKLFFKRISIPLESEYSKCYYYDRNYVSLLQEDFQMANYSDAQLIPCNSWEYDNSQYSSTIVTEWDLVCSKKWLMSTVQASYMAGVLVGCLIFGVVSDRWGRRRGMLIALVIFCCASIATSFAPYYWAFITGRFLIAVSAPGISGCCFVFITEVAPTKWRAMVGLSFQIPFGLGYAVLPGLAYILRDWKYLQLTISVPSTILLTSICFLPESPRWLINNGRYEEAICILKKCASAHGRNLPPYEEMENLMKILHKKELESRSSGRFRSLRLVTRLCSTTKIFKQTITAYFTWFVVALVYYGLALNSPNLGGDPYIVVFLGGILEIPAYIIGFLVVNKIGRRITYSTTFLLAGTVCFFIVFTPGDMTWLTSSLAVFGKFVISITFAISYVYTAELFPTEIRNIAVSYGSVCARVGSISAPYIVYLLITYHTSIPLILFGLLATTAGIVSLLLPETSQRHLTETIEDIELASKI